MSKPEFSFMANGTDAADMSGVATWRHTIGDRTLKYHQPFRSFEGALVLNELITHAYEAGLRDGDERVCTAVDRALREYR